MATVKGVNQTLVDAGGIATIGAGLKMGKVRVSTDSYSMASMTGTSDVLKLFGALPKGAKILMITLTVTANQTSLTFKLGTSYNDDEFKAAGCTDLQTAGTYQYEGKAYEVGTADDDDQIIITNAAAAGSAANLYAAVYYVTD